MDRCRVSSKRTSTETPSTPAESDLEPPVAVRFLRIEEVLTLTGVRSRSGLYRMIGAGEFPRGERVSHRLVVWPESVVARWQAKFLQGNTEKIDGRR